MKKFFFFSLLATLSVLNACKDDDTHSDVPNYQIEIDSPDTTDKVVGDTLDVHVHFSDKNEGTIHHVNVRIFNKDTGVEIYNKPTEAHIHADKEYSFEDLVELTTAGHWVLEAKVWGHDDGLAEVTKSVEFHVN